MVNVSLHNSWVCRLLVASVELLYTWSARSFSFFPLLIFLAVFCPLIRRLCNDLKQRHQSDIHERYSKSAIDQNSISFNIILHCKNKYSSVGCCVCFVF